MIANSPSVATVSMTRTVHVLITVFVAVKAG